MYILKFIGNNYVPRLSRKNVLFLRPKYHGKYPAEADTCWGDKILKLKVLRERLSVMGQNLRLLGMLMNLNPPQMPFEKK